jgi:hypothetical protein
MDVRKNRENTGSGALMRSPRSCEGTPELLEIFLDGQELFAGLFHMYAAAYKDLRDRLQPSNKESGEEVVLQEKQNKRRKRGSLK